MIETYSSQLWNAKGRRKKKNYNKKSKEKREKNI
jgi:hypothetical protein